MDRLEDQRRKLMKQVNLTEEGLNAMRPSTTGSVKQLFASGDAVAEKNNQRLNKIDAFEVQKDIIHYVEINEYLIQFLSQHWLPKFKAEKALQYKRIMREFAWLEISNSNMVKGMWTNVLLNH